MEGGKNGGQNEKKKQLDLDVGIEEGLLVAQMQTKKKAVLSDTQEKKNTKKYHVFPSKACTTTHSGS